MAKHSLRVFSRHPSHRPLRKAGLFFPFYALIRLGSTTTTGFKYKVEINSPQGVKNSASKLLMKQKFTEAGVPTADWWTIRGAHGGYLADAMFNKAENIELSDLPYPVVSKHIFGSRGTGNQLHKDAASLNAWLEAHAGRLDSYIFERYYSYNREYRLHVSAEGCFYACRKVLRNGQQDRWFRNSHNCNWLLEDNPKFDKPVNWDKIVGACVTALAAVGLDVAAFDVRVQSARTDEGKLREDPRFILLESNSAPSFGETTLKKYTEQIPKIIQFKLKQHE